MSVDLKFVELTADVLAFFYNIHPFEAVIHIQRSTHKVRKSASQVILSRMQITLHATCPTPNGASRLVRAMPAWSAKTRPALSRHYRDARVYTLRSYRYGHAWTEYTPLGPKIACYLWLPNGLRIRSCNTHKTMFGVAITLRYGFCTERHAR